ncbi:MAG TPA: sugar transferase [Candidatus Aminicenantes bacterium]|jgi:Sugar transferases involved in lipopolysaccharide synthesis|nr:sugar transferase [Acidobacteriota bacterium]OQB58003.1 MAG: putative sugar transferase EpsL [Candidatus Aminicenantes bacterium ADurb.Bin147]HNQ81377.1 sugar transferase [Candidatus Aminicenantes bacterium]HNT32969.1 sugar transferase [Candidatus Aminicenantes bacterium]HOU49037.1 sugar transferase [Candidatus Aminicenantes bacterium]
MKRAFDLGASGLGLLLLSPVFLLVAVLIFLADGRPVLFRQTRIGRAGRPFSLFKFRTMIPASEGEGGGFEPGDSRRVTSFGRFLRKTKIDEWPQLFNVLKGDMSMVGPRPEVSKWVAAYPRRWAVVHRVKPGITDPASIIYRNEEELLAAAADPEAVYRNEILPRKLDLYERYAEGPPRFGRDLGLIFKTIAAVLKF